MLLTSSRYEGCNLVVVDKRNVTLVPVDIRDAI